MNRSLQQKSFNNYLSKYIIMTTKCIDTINPKVFFADAKEIWIAVALLQKHIAKQLLSNAKTLDTNLIHIIVGIDFNVSKNSIF